MNRAIHELRIQAPVILKWQAFVNILFYI